MPKCRLGDITDEINTFKRHGNELDGRKLEATQDETGFVGFQTIGCKAKTGETSAQFCDWQ